MMVKYIVYFLMMTCIFLYNYILSGESSILMLYTLIFMPIFSIIFTYPVKSRLEIFFQIPNRELEKDGIIDINLTIKNKSIFPAPFIIISFVESLNLSISHPSNISIFLGPMQSKSITVKYKGKYRGVAKIGVKDIVLKDYMGFLKISLLKEDMKKKQGIGEVVVTPKLIHIKPNNKILGNSNNVKEEAENPSNNLFAWNGEPGYEFREYIPGDPLHKIHWKLSAKYETLMVRKNEGSSAGKKLLIIDPYISTDERKKELLKSKKNQNIERNLMIEEKILEGVIAIANVNITFGKEVDICLLEGDKWNKYLLKDAKSISWLKYKLAHFEFKWSLDSKSLNRIPPIDIMAKDGDKPHSKIGDIVIFTGTEDKLLANEINKLLDSGVAVNIAMIESLNETESKKRDILYSRIMLDHLWIIDIKEDLDKAFL